MQPPWRGGGDGDGKGWDRGKGGKGKATGMGGKGKGGGGVSLPAAPWLPRHEPAVPKRAAALVPPGEVAPEAGAEAFSTEDRPAVQCHGVAVRPRKQLAACVPHVAVCVCVCVCVPRA